MKVGSANLFRPERANSSPSAAWIRAEAASAVFPLAGSRLADPLEVEGEDESLTTMAGHLHKWKSSRREFRYTLLRLTASIPGGIGSWPEARVDLAERWARLQLRQTRAPAKVGRRGRRRELASSGGAYVLDQAVINGVTGGGAARADVEL